MTETNDTLQWSNDILINHAKGTTRNLRHFIHVFEGTLAAVSTALIALGQATCRDVKLDIHTASLDAMLTNFRSFLDTPFLEQTIKVLYLVRATDSCNMLYIDEDAILSVSRDMLLLAEWQTRTGAAPAGIVTSMRDIPNQLKGVCKGRQEYHNAVANFDLLSAEKAMRQSTTESAEQVGGHSAEMLLSMVETLPRTSTDSREDGNRG